MSKLKVAFVCVHNSCRSQIAEALGKCLCSDVFESYSVGTEIKDAINSEAVSIMKNIYNIDMEENQYPKLLEDIPVVDIVITMGCNVKCPILPCRYREDLGLYDSTNKSYEEYRNVIEQIEKRMLELKSI